MYSIFENGGKQYTVKVGDVLSVDLMENNENDKVTFDKVMSITDNNDVIFGNPYIKNAKIEAKVLQNVKDKKVIVFKFKRKTTFKKLRGHRQKYTVVQIENISKGD